MFEQSPTQSLPRTCGEHTKPHQVEDGAIRAYEGVGDDGSADHVAGTEAHLVLETPFAEGVREQKVLELNETLEVIIGGFANGGAHDG